MRYIINAKEKTINPSNTIVDGTVVFTFIIGLIFLYVGLKFNKMWIQFWGIMTISASFLYFLYKIYI